MYITSENMEIKQQYRQGFAIRRENKENHSSFLSSAWKAALYIAHKYHLLRK